MKKSYILFKFIFLFITFISTTLAESRVREYDFKKNIDFNKLNYHKVQTLYFAILSFHKTIGKDFKNEKQRSVFFKYYQSLIDEAYASDGEMCFFGGWPSELVNGICKHPRTHGIGDWRGSDSSYSQCSGSNTFRCNPLLFGPGDNGKGMCLTLPNGYEGLTEKCEKASNSPENIDKIFNNFLDKPELLKGLLEDASKFCGLDAARNKFDHALTCSALDTRMNLIVQKFRDEEVAAKSRIPAVSKEVNKALGLLDACEKSYKDDAGWLGSQREILNVVAVSAVCPQKDLYEQMAEGEFQELMDTAGKIEEKIVPDALLGTATDSALELSVKNLALSMYQFNEDVDFDQIKNEIFSDSDRKELKQSPYKQKVEKYLSEIEEGVKENSVPKVDLKALIREPAASPGQPKTFRNYQQEVNQLCNNIRVDYQNSNIEKGTIFDTDEEEQFYSQKQQDFNKIVTEMKSSHHIGRIMATGEFYSKVFPFSGNLAEKCAEGDILNAMKIPSDKEIDKSVADYKDLLLDDLEDSAENIKALNSGDPDEMFDEIRDMLKYKPYLVGNFLKQQSPEDQLTYAKYICKESLDIYNTDENWRIAEVTAGGVGLVAAGLLVATGFGAPIGAAVAKGSTMLLAAGMVAEAGMAYQNYTDGSAIDTGASTGFTLNQISTENYAGQKSNAEAQIRDAKISAALVVLEPAAVLAKPTFTFARNAVRARRLGGGVDDATFYAAKEIDEFGNIVQPPPNGFGVPPTSSIKALPPGQYADDAAWATEDIASASQKVSVEYVDDLGIVRTRSIPKKDWDVAVANSKLSAQERTAAIHDIYMKHFNGSHDAFAKGIGAKTPGEYRELMGKQYKAILDAHEMVPCAVGKCSPSQLAKKREIMTAAGVPKKIQVQTIRQGITGFSDESVDSINQARKAAFSSTDPAAGSGVVRGRGQVTSNDIGTQKLISTLSGNVGAKDTVVVTVERTLPDGKIVQSQIKTKNGFTGDGKIVMEDYHGVSVIDLSDTNLRVTNISREVPSYVDGNYTRVLDSVYESNPTRALENMVGQRVKITNRIDPDDKWSEGSTVGEIVMKDGKPHLMTNNGPQGRAMYQSVDKYENISSIERIQSSNTWNPSDGARDLPSRFGQGDDVSITYQKQQTDSFGRPTGDPVVVEAKGEFVDVVMDGSQQAVFRTSEGNLQYIDVRFLQSVSSSDLEESVFRLGQ